LDQNNITGDRLVSKAANKNYRDNFDNVFKIKPEANEIVEGEAEAEFEIVFSPDFPLNAEDEDVGC